MRKLYVVLVVVFVAIGLAVSGAVAFTGKSSNRQKQQGPVTSISGRGQPSGSQNKPCSPKAMSTPCPSG